MHIFDFPDSIDESEALQQLAKKAKGNFLFFMGQEDWIRPDLLYRYEQTLRAMEEPENCVLYCDHNLLNSRDAFIPCSECRQPSEFNFPYFFKQMMVKGMLVPARLWKQIEEPLFIRELRMRIFCCAWI